MKKVDVIIIDYMMSKKAKLGNEKSKISELQNVLNIKEKKLGKALKRLEKDFIIIDRSDKSKYNCRYQEICNDFYEDSFTCTNGGGSYCGKYREFDTIFRNKTRNDLINIKILLLEVS